jgi:hypothetical protein
MFKSSGDRHADLCNLNQIAAVVSWYPEMQMKSDRQFSEAINRETPREEWNEGNGAICPGIRSACLRSSTTCGVQGSALGLGCRCKLRGRLLRRGRLGARRLLWSLLLWQMLLLLLHVWRPPLLHARHLLLVVLLLLLLLLPLEAIRLLLHHRRVLWRISI